MHTLGIGRHRLVTGELLEERVRIVTYAETPADILLELDLASDSADIFEVRGWLRQARGRLLPVALRSDRVTFRYDGRDGRRVRTHLAFSEPAAEWGAGRAHAAAMADRAVPSAWPGAGGWSPERLASSAGWSGAPSGMASPG